ncbi:unnamed protein product [Scytosiphon promiscuus]
MPVRNMTAAASKPRRVLVATLLLLVLTVASGKDIIVSPDDGNTPFQDALDEAEAGDTIILGDGEYFENVETKTDGTKNARIIIKGESLDAVLRGDGPRGRTLQIKHDYYTVEAFTIDGEWDTSGDDPDVYYKDKLIYADAERSPTMRDGGYLAAMDGLIIRDMKMETAGGECVRVRGWATFTEIYDNDIRHCGKWDFVHENQETGKNGEGIYIGTSSNQWGDDGIDITRETHVHHNFILTNGAEGIDVKEGSVDTLIEHNRIFMQLDDDSAGIGSRASSTIIRYNYMEDAEGAGVRLGGHFVDGVQYGVKNQVYGNEIVNCRAYGVKIMVDPQFKICENDIEVPPGVDEDDYKFTRSDVGTDSRADCPEDCDPENGNDDCPDDTPVCCEERSYCISPDAGDYTVSSCGDPHMVGFLGQKFDFTGGDGAWYCLMKDSPTFQMNMRVTNPVAELPQITYITGLSILTTDTDGIDHSIVITVKDPHVLESSCPDGMFPCLADGALDVVLDGHEELMAPGTVILGRDVMVSAANLPGECRSFGFEKYWERKKLEASLAHGRRLDDAVSMAEWILTDPTMTNAQECVEYVTRTESEEAGVFAHNSEHVSFQIVTPTATVRLSHGRLHQVAMRDPTDQFDLPDHLTWQMNMGLERNSLNRAATGILGETFEPTLDPNGVPIMSGMGAIRGKDEDDYRVDGPFGVVFAQDKHTP